MKRRDLETRLRKLVGTGSDTVLVTTSGRTVRARKLFRVIVR
jgi:hypothetical protein